jgi:5'-3' exonuclease
VQVHLVDGTYELFRHYYAVPSAKAPDGREVGAVRGVLSSLCALLRGGATHVGVAFDSVVESFRNRLFDGYKTGAGIEPALLSQFPLVEAAVAKLGIVVWPMVEFEADDALATAARQLADDPVVGRVLLCTPDKDLAQCVRGQRVVQFDRRKELVLDEAAVVARYGVPPAAIADLLALVGDAQDGIPGVPKWGSKSAATVLAHYGSLDAIPDQAAAWTCRVRGAETLAAQLAANRTAAALYRTLATLRTDVPIVADRASLRWRGPQPELPAFLAALGAERLLARVPPPRPADQD